MEDLMKSAEKLILSRYTQYKYLEDILVNCRLALLNPQTWPDKNDTSSLIHYMNINKFTALFAACFTQSSETNHHWQVYGENESVRIVFNRELLLSATTNDCRYIAKEVNYVKINEFKDVVTCIDQLPFVKRMPYRDEKEFRIIWQGEADGENLNYLPLPEYCIEKISIGPKVSPNRAKKMISEIKMMMPYKIRVNNTTIERNTRWINMIQSI